MIPFRLESIFLDTPEEDYEQYLFDARVEEHLADEEMETARFEENLAEIEHEQGYINNLIKEEPL